MNGDSVAQPRTPGPEHGGGNDPPHQQSDGESDLYDTTNLAPEEARKPPGTVFWQFVIEQDWWNSDVWVDFDPCWSANVDRLYASMASYMAPGAIGCCCARPRPKARREDQNQHRLQIQLLLHDADQREDRQGEKDPATYFACLSRLVASTPALQRGCLLEANAILVGVQK